LTALALVLIATVGAAFVLLSKPTTAAAIAGVDARITVADGPGGTQRTTVDTTMYTPKTTPAPAVIVSPGFGGTKDSVRAYAQKLAANGYVVLAYTPRGFGASTGEIALNDPDYEVADARGLIDYLGKSTSVIQDGAGDPRVAITGGSYGGALSLLVAGLDKRVDAIAPMITYNDLTASLLPNGVSKKMWIGQLFAVGQAQQAGSTNPICGRYTAQVCQAFQQLAEQGQLSADNLALLKRNSPTTYNANVKAPTFLVQGSQDALFGLDQSDANAKQISANGTPVKTVWYAGGHGGDTDPGDAIEGQVIDWFNHYLKKSGSTPSTSFSYQVAGSLRQDGTRSIRTVTTSAYPGLASGTSSQSFPLSGATQAVLTPAGGQPAAISGLPGLSIGGLSSSVARDVPGQYAQFDTPTLASQLSVAGASTVHLKVTSDPGSDVVLFVKLYDVAADGTQTLPGSLVAPITVPANELSTGSTQIFVTLPGIVQPVQSGHKLRLVVSTTDQAYQLPNSPALHQISVTGALSVPIVVGTASAVAGFPTGQLVAIVVLVLLIIVALLIARFRRNLGDDLDSSLAEIPLRFHEVSKVYPGDLTVVDGVSFTVERGQIVGLLGPNGAGKTTTLRMLMGLITPTRGDVRVFGHRIHAGSPALSRIGSFVEKAGLLPHLSGIENLRLYWTSTGRPSGEARLEEALEIADLGKAVHRKTGTYSQGMRQRLAIAQAMLGLPELLILDEPTNGMDPPQISQMREVLHRYAATGRTVLVSSHILAEIEQTCSHVVVMNHGKLVTSGEIAAIAPQGHLEDAFLELVKEP
jgi:ABC-2 type transport system ATP-binding protein